MPPRDTVYHHDMPKVSSLLQKKMYLLDMKCNDETWKFHLQPDYDDIEDENRIKLMARGKSDKGKDNKKYGK